MVWRALIAVLALAGAAQAESRVERVIEAWRGWASERGVAAGQIVVLQEGEPVARGAIGGASGPVDLASLAKAVTGVCLARLIDEGAATWGDPVGKWAPAAKAPLRDATLGALLTHSAGLAPDETQSWMPILRGEGPTAYGAVVNWIGDRPLQAPKYAYNNENYGVLAVAIEAIAGRPYEEVCAQDGLVPSPVYGRFAAWGGWRGDLVDYGRFHWTAFGGADPTTAPSAPAFSEEVRYGLGTIWRAFRGDYNFWHFGALCFAGGDQFMTHAVLYADGLGVVSRVEGCPEGEWFGSLDAAIVEGAFR